MRFGAKAAASDEIDRATLDDGAICVPGRNGEWAIESS